MKASLLVGYVNFEISPRLYRWYAYLKTWREASILWYPFKNTSSDCQVHRSSESSRTVPITLVPNFSGGGGRGSMEIKEFGILIYPTCERGRGVKFKKCTKASHPKNMTQG